MGLKKLWRDQAAREAMIGLFGLAMTLFGKGRRAEIIAQIINDTPGKLAAFREARDLINAAEAEGGGAILSVEQTAAMDDFLDLVRRPKRELKRILRDGY